MAEHKRHQGHRQRMRERVQNYGLDSLAEHEALEYVLYLTNAQKDTNGIAHDLIDRFGDFAAVLEASEEELCTVEGVGPATARMFVFCRRSAVITAAAEPAPPAASRLPSRWAATSWQSLHGRTTSAPCW